jgi:hypothetical protein
MNKKAIVAKMQRLLILPSHSWQLYLTRSRAQRPHFMLIIKSPNRRLGVPGQVRKYARRSDLLIRFAARFPELVERQCHHQEANNDKICPGG